MEKIKATELLGGSDSAAAKAIGITPQAYSQWPAELPPRLEDRVFAALYRRTMKPAKARKPKEASHA